MTTGAQISGFSELIPEGAKAFGQLLELSADGLVLIRGERIIDCNGKALDIMHMDRDEVIGKCPWELTPLHQPGNKPSRQAARQRMDAALSGELQRFEWHVLRSDAGISVLDITLSKIGGEGDIFLCSTIRDITGLKSTLAELTEKTAFLDSIYHDSALAFSVVDVARDERFVFTDVNVKWQQSNRMTREEVVGSTAYELVPRISEEDAELIDLNFRRVVIAKSSLSYYAVMNTRGREVWWNTTLTPVLNESGEVKQIVITALDVSRLKHTQFRLQQALREITQLKDQIQLENIYLRDEVKQAQGFEEIIGTSAELMRCLGQVEQVAPLDTTVLILGETGAGKELIARTLHDRSSRSEHPLISINCAALPPDLIESELFGHEKGAFSGAHKARKGRLELAGQGTLFLDEIGDLRLDLQTKLLRVIQENVFERVGGNAQIEFKARVLAATNQDLAQAIGEGKFRQDLYYRLNVFPIRVPPLRDRAGDVSLLATHFARRFARQYQRPFLGFTDRMESYLAAHHFPGNIRELQNLVERAFIVSSDALVDLPFEVNIKAIVRPGSKKLEDIERHHIRQVLEECDWIIQGPGAASEILGMAASTLRHRMRKLGISRPSDA